jgi:hypothetical protein
MYRRKRPKTLTEKKSKIVLDKGYLIVVKENYTLNRRENSMNYIKKLEQQNREKTRDIIAIQAELRDLVIYLNSDKFHEDTTVQVSDVLRRIAPALSLTMNDYS